MQNVKWEDWLKKLYYHNVLGKVSWLKILIFFYYILHLVLLYLMLALQLKQLELWYQLQRLQWLLQQQKKPCSHQLLLPGFFPLLCSFEKLKIIFFYIHTKCFLLIFAYLAHMCSIIVLRELTFPTSVFNFLQSSIICLSISAVAFDGRLKLDQLSVVRVDTYLTLDNGLIFE